MNVLKLENVHHSDVIMSTMASQITSLTIVYSSVYSGADQRKHQSSASLVFVRGIHRWPVNSPHKGPVTRETFSFDDVIMYWSQSVTCCHPHASEDDEPNHNCRDGRSLYRSVGIGIPSNERTKVLTHWCRDNMAALSQMTFLNAFSWAQIYKFLLEFHRNVFLRVQLTIFQHWIR